MLNLNLKKLQNLLGYNFKNTRLLEQALCHRSSTDQHNEQLEFLGDAVLELIISSELYRQFHKTRSEGELTRMRAQLVKRQTLAELGLKWRLFEWISVGLGERKSGAQSRHSILADTVEALIAAIYLDSNHYQITQDCVLSWYQEAFENLKNNPITGVQKDSKTALQEYRQARNQALPVYQLESVYELESGQQKMTVSCCLLLENAQPITYRGEGFSRREAEQLVAKKILETLETIKN